MEIGGIVSKLTAKADLLGAIAGVATSTTNGLGDVIDVIAQLTQGKIHAPDFKSALGWWITSPTTQQALLAYAAGYVIDIVNPPMIGKYGTAIQKAGLGYAIGSLAVRLAISATHSGEGGGRSAPSGGYGY